MTFKNFTNAQIGSARLYEQNQQGEWERARWLACVVINPHLKKPVSPSKITEFYWEKKRKNKSKKDVQKLIKESIYQDKIQELKNKKNA